MRKFLSNLFVKNGWWIFQLPFLALLRPILYFLSNSVNVVNYIIKFQFFSNLTSGGKKSPVHHIFHSSPHHTHTLFHIAKFNLLIFCRFFSFVFESLWSAIWLLERKISEGFHAWIVWYNNKYLEKWCKILLYYKRSEMITLTRVGGHWEGMMIYNEILLSLKKDILFSTNSTHYSGNNLA